MQQTLQHYKRWVWLQSGTTLQTTPTYSESVPLCQYLWIFTSQQQVQSSHDI